MWRYVMRRLLWAVVTLVLVTAFVFAIFFVLPGGAGRATEGGYPPVAVKFAGKYPTPAIINSVIDRLGLDEPLHVQFGKYVLNAAQGDLGYSYQTQEPVTEAILRRLPATAALAIGASIVWLVLGCAIGIISALRRRTMVDRASMVFALGALSVPDFWLGLMAVFFFDARLRVYETGNYVGITQNVFQWLSVMWLPWLLLGITSAALYSRMVRGNMLEVAGEDYIRTARAKGLREGSVVRHELRSALTPVVTMYGLDLGILLGGLIITEHIFNIPGIGAYAVNAITHQNLPVILGTTLFAAFFVIVANLVVDIAYAVLDPRIVYS